MVRARVKRTVQFRCTSDVLHRACSFARQARTGPPARAAF